MPQLASDGPIADSEGQVATLVRAAERANAYATAYALGLQNDEAPTMQEVADAAGDAKRAAKVGAAAADAASAAASAADAARAAAAGDFDDAARIAGNITGDAATARSDFNALGGMAANTGSIPDAFFKRDLWPDEEKPGDSLERFYAALESIGCGDVASRYRQLSTGRLEFSVDWLKEIEAAWNRLNGTGGAQAKSGKQLVGTGAASDLPTLDDHLGQGRLVRGLRDFLRSEKTKTPLTISIEARWGAGKSSFMLKLREALPRAEFAKVWFNPWRHEKNEELWAAFALCLVRQLEAEMSRLDRFRARFAYARAAMRRGALVSRLLPSILQMAAWLAVMAGGAWAFYCGLTSGEVGKLFSGKLDSAAGFGAIGGAVGGPLAFAFALRWLIKQADGWIGRPADIDIERHLDRPDYATRTTFLEHFHRDFRRLLLSYGGRKKIVVFIDDLDRCDVPRAAELVQGINLLMSGAEPEVGSGKAGEPKEEPRLIFILGIDRAKVAAGIAVKHEKLLPYLYAERLGVGEKAAMNEAARARAGLDYGYDYLEKFVQIPFRLPRAEPKLMAAYIDELIQKPAATAAGESIAGAAPAAQPATASGAATTDKAGESRDETPVGEGGKAARRPPVEPPPPVEINEDWMRGPARLAAPLFENNPRRVKQFVALLRLTAYLLRSEAGELDPTTLRQLGKFLAMLMRWPQLAVDLEKDPGLFLWLDTPPENANPLQAKWRREAGFEEFLQAIPDPPEEGVDPDDYDLRGANLQAFLAVAGVTRVERESPRGPK